MIGKTISHYRVLGQIGEGGMGVVYVAEDTRFGRRIAIKIPHAGKDESHYRSRFLKEARAVSRLNHRNIATVYDMGETDDGRPYIVMELVSGQTLGDVLAGPGLSVARAVEVIREVAEALAEAHSHNIIHRDIKPSNVIISDKGEVKVLDFGLAKQLEEDGTKSRAMSEHTRSDVVIGTPLYLSPEQARGAKVDPRSDLFTLGALLYECVSGRPAFSGANVIEIGAQVLHFDPPPPSRSNPRVPAELDRLVKRALAKKPEDRFQTAKEFAEELSRVRARIPDSDSARTRRLAGVDTLARSSAFITMAETLKRPRLSLLSVLGVGAVVALALFGSYYLFMRRTAHVPNPGAVVLYEQGVEAMREGAYFRATGLLNQAVKADDKYALAHARLAEAWTELDFLDRAKDEMLAATTLVPDINALEREDALYFDAIRSTLSRHFPEAVKNYEELARLKPVPQRLVDLGRAHVKNDDTAKAVDAFTQAASRDETYAAASLSLGTLHARQRNLAAATTAFDRAEKLYAAAGNREGEAEVHYQRGRLFVDLNRKDEARGELAVALAAATATGNVYQQVQAKLQLAYLPDDLAQAESLATEALNLAQSSGMQNLVVRGYIDLGVQYLSRKSFDEADRNLVHGLDAARSYQSRRLEALALVNLASLRERQNRFEDAVKFAQQAHEFYSKGGYRKEDTAAGQIIARVKARQGDYEGARAALEEQIRANESSSDSRMLGQLHRECGSVLSKQNRSAEAVRHYREAIAIAKSLSDNTLLSYSLLNIADSLWQLGRYDDAEQYLAQLVELAQARQPPDGDMLTRVALVQAAMDLSRRRFTDARAKSGQALAALQQVARPKEVKADAEVLICLAEALGGAPLRGKTLCDEAARVADDIGDPVFISVAQLALAEALLGAGDPAGARETALRAEEFFARSENVESDWRALALLGMACRRSGDETTAHDYFTRAAAQLSKLEQSLGEEAAGYLSRPDVQRLRRELGGDAVAEAR
ncbi:MAG TPA: protein kinase [Pyrinomonadaceae bacterium]|jgi:serine/threonine-protein kinase|nr:protein kinase [Pyrinomonadaceae bacterium]